jgi:hypothetical protein
MATVRARFIEPMLLQQTAKLPEGAQWLYELSSTDTGRSLSSPAARSISAPAITKALAAMPDEPVIDGEVVALNGFDLRIIAGQDLMMASAASISAKAHHRTGRVVIVPSHQRSECACGVHDAKRPTDVTELQPGAGARRRGVEWAK